MTPFFFLLFLGPFSGLSQHFCVVELVYLSSAVLIKSEETYRNASISRLSAITRGKSLLKIAYVIFVILNHMIFSCDFFVILVVFSEFFLQFFRNFSMICDF